MSYNDIWSKYGITDKKEQISVSTPEEAPVFRETPKTEKNRTEYKKDEPMSGVFGSDTSSRTNHRQKKSNINFDFGQLKTLPWVDIICILITVFMIANVAVNFEEVTNSIFYTMLPILNEIAGFGFIAAVIAAVVLIIRNRLRRRRDRNRFF